MAAVDEALREYRNIGGSRTGEAAIRRGVQANTFTGLGWNSGRAEYLFSYLYMLRNALLKNTDQHRALGYFMEHYQRNQAVNEELKEWQIDQIEMLPKQINDAPDINEFPPGDVELMARYFDRFHTMLVNYGRSPPLRNDSSRQHRGAHPGLRRVSLCTWCRAFVDLFGQIEFDV